MFEKVTEMPVSLLTLPVEIKLKILNHTDAHTVQRIKRLCSQLKRLVDENEGFLADKIRNREIARLQQVIDYHDYSQLPLIDALGRWVEHKGLFADISDIWKSNIDFTKHYMCDRGPSSVSGATNHDVQDLADGLIMLYTEVHTPYAAGRYSPISDVGSFLDKCRGSTSTIGDDVWRDFYRHIVAEPTCLQGSVHQFENQYERCIPQRLLTRLNGGSSSSCSPMLENGNDFIAAFGLPSISKTNMFAYYVEDDKANSIVTQARMDIVWHQHRNGRPLLVAAALELLRIF